MRDLAHHRGHHYDDRKSFRSAKTGLTLGTTALSLPEASFGRVMGKLTSQTSTLSSGSFVSGVWDEPSKETLQSELSLSNPQLSTILSASYEPNPKGGGDEPQSPVQSLSYDPGAFVNPGGVFDDPETDEFQGLDSVGSEHKYNTFGLMFQGKSCSDILKE